MWMFPKHELTCLGVDGKESLRIPTGYSKREIIAWFSVWVKRLDLDNGDVFGGVLRYRWEINRFWCQWSIIIDILNLNVDFHKWGKRHNSLIRGRDCEPVMTGGLTVQNLLCSYNAYDKDKKKHVDLHVGRLREQMNFKQTETAHIKLCHMVLRVLHCKHWSLD